MPFDKNGNYIPICFLCGKAIPQTSPFSRIITEEGLLDGDSCKVDIIKCLNAHPICFNQLIDQHRFKGAL